MKGKRRNAAAVLLSAALSVQSVLLPIAAISPTWRQTEVSPDETVIYASDYGADPTGTFDSTEAIQKTFAAAKEAREADAKSVRVEFEKGTYQIWKDKCEKRLVHTSNTSSTDGYGEKTIGLLIEDQSDLVVEGNGAQFLMHGNIMALGVFRSKNIELRNFSWDFAVPTTSEMTVINMGQDESGKNFTDFYIPKTMPHQISGNTIVWTSERSIYTGETYWQETGPTIHGVSTATIRKENSPDAITPMKATPSMARRTSNIWKAPMIRLCASPIPATGRLCRKWA